MGYDIVNVGEYDLTMGGVEFLGDLKEQARFTFVSSNLFDGKASGEFLNPT